MNTIYGKQQQAAITPLNQLGSRICILGCSGSGKSTLAQHLGSELSIEVTHLDTLAHRDNTHWQRVSNAQLINAQHTILNNQNWIIEGNYSACMNQRLAKATSVIWLDMHIIRCLIRYVLRSLKRNPTRPGRLKGAKSEFSWRLVKHILFLYPKNRLKYEKTLKNYPHLQLIRINSLAELKNIYHVWGISYRKA